MVTVRQLTLVAVAAWLGAMGFFAFVVAPAAFSTLGADGSRAVSGPGLREFFNDLAAVPLMLRFDAGMAGEPEPECAVA